MTKKVRIIKKNDAYSMEYEVGDELVVDSTWYGGVTVLGRTGIPVSLDKEEYEEIALVETTELCSAPPHSKAVDACSAVKADADKCGMRPEGQGISTDDSMDLTGIEKETIDVLRSLLEVADLKEGDALVVGCSSSEVANMKIGSYSSAEIGKCIATTILDELSSKGIYLAAQCCEHLNRAIIVERQYARENRIPIVNARPQLKAGGSFATAAYSYMKEPVAIEHIQAQAGIDIGDTLIGMHLAPVAVPVRSEHSHIGGAHVVMARTRAKYIGGVRTAYEDGI